VLGVARPNSATLRLLSEPTARARRQLDYLHDVEDWSLACRCRELERRGRAMFMWVPNPTLRPPCVGPALVRDGSYSCEWVVRYRLLMRTSCQRQSGKSSCEAETPRTKRRLLMRGGDLSCEAETAREAETPRARRKLVGEVTHWSEMGWYCQ
jgi:hypothetical protein